MTNHKFDNFSQYFHNWQKNIINFGLKRNLADKELENYMEQRLQRFYSLNNDLIQKLNDIGIEVQTKRLCSQPILSYDQQFYSRNLNETLTRIHEQLDIMERAPAKLPDIVLYRVRLKSCSQPIG